MSDNRRLGRIGSTLRLLPGRFVRLCAVAAAALNAAAAHNRSREGKGFGCAPGARALTVTRPGQQQPRWSSMPTDLTGLSFVT